MRDFSAAPSWRPDLERVEMIATADNHVRFREHGEQGAITYDLIEDRPGEKIVTRIADQDLGYSGAWTYTFTKEAEGTRVQITKRARCRTFCSGSCRVSSLGTPERWKNTSRRSGRNSAKRFRRSHNRVAGSIADVAVAQRLVTGRGHLVHVPLGRERLAEGRRLVENRPPFFRIEPFHEQKHMAVRPCS